MLNLMSSREREASVLVVAQGRIKVLDNMLRIELKVRKRLME